MPDDQGSRTVGVSDMPRTIKGYMWFDDLAGRSIKIEQVSLIGNNKGATRYAAVVVCKSRSMAKDFARRVKDKAQGPRAKVLNDDKEVEKFRTDMVKNKGWSNDAPDGDAAINAHSGADIRGDATGFSHGFNPHKRRGSTSPRRSPSPTRRRSPSSGRSPCAKGGPRSRSRGRQPGASSRNDSKVAQRKRDASSSSSKSASSRSRSRS